MGGGIDVSLQGSFVIQRGAFMKYAPRDFATTKSMVDGTHGRNFGAQLHSRSPMQRFRKERSTARLTESRA